MSRLVDAGVISIDGRKMVANASAWSRPALHQIDHSLAAENDEAGDWMVGWSTLALRNLVSSMASARTFLTRTGFSTKGVPRSTTATIKVHQQTPSFLATTAPQPAR